jgi:hypothetical protein
MTDNGGTTGSRVFRAYDGVTVKVPEFSGVYESRMRVMGRYILASHVDLKQVRTMRVYDVLEGKDVWRQEFPQGSIVMESEDPRLAGVIEPSGAIRVIDVQTQKEVLTAKLADPKHVLNNRSVHLLADPDYLFVAINGQLNNNEINGDFLPNVSTAFGMRSIPVNGMLYAFTRKDGKLLYYNQVDHEQLVVSQFEDLPLLFFTTRFNRAMGNLPFRQFQPATNVRAVAKHNGKLWYYNDSDPIVAKKMEMTPLPAGLTFHDLKMDHRTGKVEVGGYSFKVSLTSVAK